MRYKPVELLFGCACRTFIGHKPASVWVSSTIVRKKAARDALKVLGLVVFAPAKSRRLPSRWRCRRVGGATYLRGEYLYTRYNAFLTEEDEFEAKLRRRQLMVSVGYRF
jgi:hypothetical protein